MSKTNTLPPDLRPVPEPEVRELPPRRTITAEDKLAVLREADACSEPGQIGALLRREGLYSSHLSDWRKKRAAGEIQGLAPRKRDGKRTPTNPLADQVVRLKADKARLEEHLRKARLIIDVQKILSEILGLPASDSGESSS